MKPLTAHVHDLVQNVLQPGDFAIDATMGNGHDTLFLAQQIGVLGKVYAFDIQPLAIQQTRELVNAAAIENVVLVEASHAKMQHFIPHELHGKIAAVMFNLGYLPGGDKSIITQIDSTIVAIRTAVQLLKTGGIMTVLAYVGHPGGRAEAEAVRDVMQQLSGFEDLSLPERSISPKLYVVRKAGTLV